MRQSSLVGLWRTITWSVSPVGTPSSPTRSSVRVSSTTVPCSIIASPCRARYRKLSPPDHARLNDAGRVAVVKDAHVGREPDLRRFASDGSHIDVRLGTRESLLCSDGGTRRADREEDRECKNSNDVVS